MGIFAWVTIGLIAGLVARAVIHTGRHFGCLGTIVLGILGSVVGGTLGSVLNDEGFEVRTSGILGSIAGAVVVLVVLRAIERPAR